MKKLIGAIAASAFLFGVSGHAADLYNMSYVDEPSDYQAEAISYIETRTSSTIGMRYEFIGEPYRAAGVFRGNDGRLVEWAGWAADVKVRLRLPNGGSTGMQTYTVVFAGDRAIGMEMDFRRFSAI